MKRVSKNLPKLFLSNLLFTIKAPFVYPIMTAYALFIPSALAGYILFLISTKLNITIQFIWYPLLCIGLSVIIPILLVSAITFIERIKLDPYDKDPDIDADSV